MKYTYEPHFHTSDVSTCARVCAREAAEIYKNAGYSGVVVTDHISKECMERKYPGETWKDKIDYFLRGYHNAQQVHDDSFAVILGMEARFENEDDFLVFGITEAFLYENEWFTDMTIKEFKKLAEKNQLTVIQAHPFRIDSTITNPRYIDGIEVFNGNRRHDSSNNLAKLWAEKHAFITTSGSDFHEYEDLARGGMIFDNFVTDSKSFRAEMLAGKYSLLTR